MNATKRPASDDGIESVQKKAKIILRTSQSPGSTGTVSPKPKIVLHHSKSPSFSPRLSRSPKSNIIPHNSSSPKPPAGGSPKFNIILNVQGSPKTSLPQTPPATALKPQLGSPFQFDINFYSSTKSVSPSPAGASESPSPSGGVGKPFVFGAQTTDISAHRPVAARGITFYWKDNMQYHGVKHSPFTLGVAEPQKLIIKLKSSTGVVYEYKRTDLANPKWNDAEWIARTNRWYDQIILRRLDNKKEDTRSRPSRPQWSEIEKDYLEGCIQAAIERLEKGVLPVSEWRKITDMQNARFAGKILRAGALMATGVVNKSNHLIPVRTFNAIQASVKRWADTVMVT